MTLTDSRPTETTAQPPAPASTTGPRRSAAPYIAAHVLGLAVGAPTAWALVLAPLGTGTRAVIAAAVPVALGAMPIASTLLTDRGRR